MIPQVPGVHESAPTSYMAVMPVPKDIAKAFEVEAVNALQKAGTHSPTLANIEFKSGKFPHITICVPKKDRNLIEAFLTHSKLKAFENKISSLNKTMLSSQNIYTYYDKERDTTFICLKFGFVNHDGSPDLALDKEWKDIKREIYLDMGMRPGMDPGEADFTAEINTHMTLGEVKGEIQIPDTQTELKYAVSFGASLCAKTASGWKVIEN
jgi:hypothetical protein